MAATGVITFDSLAIVTLDANVLDKSLTAKAAFVDTSRGTTHGWTEGSGTIWSQDTKDLLRELVSSMEQDMAKLHFTSAHAPPGKTKGLQMPTGGLGEHLSDDETPSA